MFSFKKVEPPKPPNKWIAHVTGEVKFESKNRYTHGEALMAEIIFKAVLTKGDKSIELNLTHYTTIEECEYSWDTERFYKRAVNTLQNRRGELDMALKNAITSSIKNHFEKESEKSAKSKFEELLKETIHIKMDIKIKDEDVFQA